MKRRLFIVNISLSFFISHASEYKHIIDRASPPAIVQSQVDRLFENQDFIDAFIIRENKMSNAQRHMIAQKYQLKKISRWHYIFRTPLVPGYILKLGGIHWTNSFGGIQFRAQETTTRNVSRVAYAQLIEDVIEQKQLQHIRTVQKYLYRIPHKEGDHERLCDDNFIVIAKDIGDMLVSPEENLEHINR